MPISASCAHAHIHPLRDSYRKCSTLASSCRTISVKVVRYRLLARNTWAAFSWTVAEMEEKRRAGCRPE